MVQTPKGASHDPEQPSGRPDGPEPDHNAPPPAAPPNASAEHHDAHAPPGLEGARLIGRLPCFVCGYDLRGLSILGNCPECGTAVRATILFRVDPEAEAFKPLARPAITAIALRVAALAALLAAVLLWVLRTAELTRGPATGASTHSPVSAAAFAALAVCAVASLAFIRPIRAARRAKSIAAALGIAAGFPLIAGGLLLVLNADAGHLPAYISERPPDPARILGRTLFNIGAVVAILGIRPNARELVARSKVLRTKRVDRQTLAAIAAALATSAVGDSVRLLSINAPIELRQILDLAGTAAIVVASVLITLGLVGSVIDSFRIARSLRTPNPTHTALLGEHKPTADTPTHADGAGA